MRVKVFAFFGEVVLALCYSGIGLQAGMEEYKKFNSGEYDDSELEEEDDAIYLKRVLKIKRRLDDKCSKLDEEFDKSHISKSEYDKKYDQIDLQYRKVFNWYKFSPTVFLSNYMKGIVSQDVLVEFETTDDISLNSAIVRYAEEQLITEYSCLEYDKYKLIPKRCMYGINLDGHIGEWEDFQEFGSLKDLLLKMFERRPNDYGIEVYEQGENAILFLNLLPGNKDYMWERTKEGIRYKNIKDDSTKYEMKYSYDADGGAYHLEESDNIPEFWKFFYEQKMVSFIDSYIGFPSCDFLLYAGIIAQFPEILERYEIGTGKSSLGNNALIFYDKDHIKPKLDLFEFSFSKSKGRITLKKGSVDLLDIIDEINQSKSEKSGTRLEQLKKEQQKRKGNNTYEIE